MPTTYKNRLSCLYLIVAALLLSSVGCSAVSHARQAMDFRSMEDVLSDYTDHKNPKEVLHWLFRAGREEPDEDALVVLADWSEEQRILFIKLLDVQREQQRSAFTSAFSRALISSGKAEEFQNRFAGTDLRTVILILEQLPPSTN